MSPIMPEQCRAARAWLGWTQDDLAKRAGIGQSTVKDFEKGGPRKPIPNNRAAIQRAFADAGIACVFSEDGAAAGISWTGGTRDGLTQVTDESSLKPGKHR